MSEQSLHNSPAEPPAGERPAEGQGRGSAPSGDGDALIFFVCGFIAIAFVLVITIYLIISGIPAIREIGLIEFLFGRSGPPRQRSPSLASCP